MARDLYTELGVPHSATADEIKRAYRKLAVQFHPDKNPGNQRAEARFKAVNRAHQVLTDPRKRRLYDEFGEDGLREGFNADAARAYARARGGHRGIEDLFGGTSGAGFGDLLGELFRGKGRSRGRAAMKGSDISNEVSVEFAAALRGAELAIQLPESQREVTVRVPPGADDGDKVRVAGQGLPGVFGGPAGDLVLTVRVQPHPYFERRGMDLYLDLPISAGEAYHGAKVGVPTPAGEVTLTVPRHAQSGQSVRLRGRGVRRKEKTGDLYVRFLIKLPEAEAPDVEQAIATLDGAESSDLRVGIRF
jgi:DnaJ-class molecular chaperone